MYPNPATDLLFVGQGFENVTVSSLSGQIKTIGVKSGTIDVSDFSAGVYIVQAISSDNHKFSGRFVKLNN